MKLAVLGATGYVGGRLVPHLISSGHDMVCVSRNPQRLANRPWRQDVEVRSGDVADAASLKVALAGCDAAFYLVHAMGMTDDFARADRIGAQNMAHAAEAVGLQRIVYLGGLGSDAPSELSPHLESRHEVGRLLASGSVPVTELRAAVIIGSGSASFEMLRHLVEVLPAMICPRWVTATRCQPIAIADVLHYLGEAVGMPAGAHEIAEIGGPDVVSYRDMMNAYARCAGLRRRLILPVPVLTPRLSGHWVKLVTPLPYDLARPLVDSLVNDVVVSEARSIDRCLEAEPRARAARERSELEREAQGEAVARAARERSEQEREITGTATEGSANPRMRSGHQPLSLDEALERASQHVQDLDITTSWMDSAASRTAASPMPQDPDWAGGTVLADEREVLVDASIEDAFATVSGIGGQRGWYASQWLWQLRGAVDKLIGGVGMRRGRRHPDDLQVGDAVDFFRVEVHEPPKLLRLRAEMRVPGDAWLEWQLSESAEGVLLCQRARFHPRGVLGRLYWWSLVPIHTMIFRELIVRLASAAEARAVQPDHGRLEQGQSSQGRKS
ncbi:SDR family oxidoreductase [Candidatus Poriferisodalis sp.]|uniref:SDR family oxidoreductase n=1 Tax=Candidatus Poriferisodalis sp. TaxID=3101277 RepID=UPI003B011480